MKKILYSTVPLGMGIFYYSMFLIIFSLLLLMATGCASEKKALQKAQNKVIQSGTLSDLCAKFFPPNTQYKAGDTVVKYEYQYLPGQVVTRIKNDTTQIERVDTVYKLKTLFLHDTLTIESTAKLDAVRQDWRAVMDNNGRLNNALLIEKDESDKYKKQRNTAYISVAGLAGIFILAIFLRIKGIL